MEGGAILSNPSLPPDKLNLSNSNAATTGLAAGLMAPHKASRLHAIDPCQQASPERRVPHTALAFQPCRVHDSRWRAHSSTKPACQAPSLTSAVMLNSWAAAIWNSANQTGNPVLSAQVSPMLKDRGSHATQLGHHKKGALPQTEHLLLQSMHQTCSNTSTDPHTSKCCCFKMACWLACCDSHTSEASMQVH